MAFNLISKALVIEKQTRPLVKEVTKQVEARKDAKAAAGGGEKKKEEKKEEKKGEKKPAAAAGGEKKKEEKKPAAGGEKKKDGGGAKKGAKKPAGFREFITSPAGVATGVGLLTFAAAAGVEKKKQADKQKEEAKKKEEPKKAEAKKEEPKKAEPKKEEKKAEPAKKEEPKKDDKAGAGAKKPTYKDVETHHSAPGFPAATGMGVIYESSTEKANDKGVITLNIPQPPGSGRLIMSVRSGPRKHGKTIIHLDKGKDVIKVTRKRNLTADKESFDVIKHPIRVGRAGPHKVEWPYSRPRGKLHGDLMFTVTIGGLPPGKKAYIQIKDSSSGGCVIV